MPERTEPFEPLESYFAGLPPYETHAYEKGIAKCSDHCKTGHKEEQLRALMDSDSPQAFDAFFCLCTMYRRNRDYSLMNDLIRSHPQFEKHPLYRHILTQYLVHSEAFYDYDELLKMAYDDACMAGDNPGFLQAFCNAFVTICESCNAEDLPALIRNWYDPALTSINRAIKEDPDYAKFYVTKARIISLKRQYKEADDLIRQAISKEDSSRHDYAITISNYQNYRQRFHFDNRIFLLEERIRKLEDALAAGAVPAGTEDEAGAVPGDPIPYDGDEAYAFISYAHEDAPEVYGVLRALTGSEVRYWYDRGIEPGTEWPEEVARHIAKSAIILVMLTPASLASANVRREVNLALSEEKNMIVVELQDVEMSLGMKLQFGLYQMIRKSLYQEREFHSLLCSALKKEMKG